MSQRKMNDKELETFTKPNPEAYARFKRSRLKNRILNALRFSKKTWGYISSIILWICVVGGFTLSLIQFFQSK